MHAVVVSVNIDDRERATKHLRENVVPRVKEAPGFVAGWWVQVDDGTKGRGTVVFESEDAASKAASQIEAQAENAEGVTMESVKVGEVAAHA